MTHKWTEGLIKEGQTERWTDGQMDIHTNEQTGGWMRGQMYLHINGQTDSGTERQTVWRDRWTYIQMDRKTREQKDTGI